MAWLGGELSDVNLAGAIDIQCHEDLLKWVVSRCTSLRACPPSKLNQPTLDFATSCEVDCLLGGSGKLVLKLCSELNRN